MIAYWTKHLLKWLILSKFIHSTKLYVVRRNLTTQVPVKKKVGFALLLIFLVWFSDTSLMVSPEVVYYFDIFLHTFSLWCFSTSLKIMIFIKFENSCQDNIEHIIRIFEFLYISPNVYMKRIFSLDITYKVKCKNHLKILKYSPHPTNANSQSIIHFLVQIGIILLIFCVRHYLNDYSFTAQASTRQNEYAFTFVW